MSTCRITKSKVDTLAPPATGQSFLRDAELKGFAVRITAAGTRSFIIEKRIDGRLRRFTLAKYPELTVEQARKQAQAQLGKIATGIDPIAERLSNRKGRLTLSQAFEDFKIARRNLSSSTLTTYQWVFGGCFKDWQNRALNDITKDQVLKRHHEIGEQRGQGTANLAMRFLSSMFNFAKEYYESANGSPVVIRNPVEAIGRNRAWYPETRRQTLITPDQLPAWHAAVTALRLGAGKQDKVIADYLLLILFTGLRRNEGVRLKVSDVDLQKRLLTVQRTKNGKPHVLPLTAYLLAHLKPLIEDREGSELLFALPQKAIALSLLQPTMKRVCEDSGVSFTLHDLRRTFITVAERLDISMLAIKRLVNHSSSDVTAGYVVMDMERLRGSMEQISATLLRYISGDSSAKVLQFNAA